MKIYKLDTETDFEKLDLCLAIGNFDGIHKGHQEIINKIVIDDNIEPEPRSGRQEYLENILNKYL